MDMINWEISIKEALNKKSIKTVWTRLYLFLKFNFSEVFNIDKINENNLSTYFNLINNVFECLFDKIKIENEDDLEIIKTALFECIFTENRKDSLKSSLENYVKIVIYYTCGDRNYNQYEQSLIETNKALSNSPINIENLFADVYKTEVMKYCINYGSNSKDFQKSLLQIFLDDIQFVINEKVKDFLFPLKSPDILQKITIDEKFFYEAFFNAQKNFIFDIFMDFPESQDTLVSMRSCMYVLGTAHELCGIIRNEIRKRLIHPAVSTTNLIWSYLCIVRSVRILDETSCLEEAITPEIRNYLLKRDDAIKAIVDKILCFDSEKCEGIYMEFKEGEPLKIIDHDNISDYGDILCTYENIKKWQPDPIGVSDSKVLWHKKLDVLSLLLSLYTSQESFANEYKQLLSYKMMRRMKCNKEKERKNLETLKVKFGAKFFKDCDVMIKDIGDSQLIDANFFCRQNQYSEYNPDISVKAFVISRQYWAKLPQKTFKLPEQLQKNLDVYEQCYKSYKRNRCLQWHNTIGSVSIKLTLGSSIQVNFEVKPLQAALIYLFSNQKQWELVNLAQALRISACEARATVKFWIMKNILKRVEVDTTTEPGQLSKLGEAEVYSTIEQKDLDEENELQRVNRRKEIMDISNSNNAVDDNVDDGLIIVGSDDDDDNDSHDKSANEDGAMEVDYTNTNNSSEQIIRLWNTVKMILRFFCNQRQPPDMDKIFMMIPIYTMDDPIKISKEDLGNYLSRKVLEKSLVVKDKKYSLP